MHEHPLQRFFKTLRERPVFAWASTHSFIGSGRDTFIVAMMLSFP